MPLIVRLPGKARAGTLIDAPVSTLDVLPTVLDLLGEPVPDDLSGVSLKPLIEGDPAAPRPLFSEVKNKRARARALVEYPWKYIYNYQERRRELYHLGHDPGELENLVATEGARASRMHEQLEEWRKSRRLRWQPGEPDTLTPKQLKKLRKMGYVR